MKVITNHYDLILSFFCFFCPFVGKTQTMSLDEFKKTDLFTHFNMSETERKLIGQFTEISYRTGGDFKTFSEYQIYVNAANKVIFARQSVSRNFINAASKYDDKFKKMVVIPRPDYINVFAGDEVKSFVRALAPYDEETEEQIKEIVNGIYLKRDAYTKFIKIKEEQEENNGESSLDEFVTTYSGETEYAELRLASGNLEMKNTLVNNEKMLITTINFAENQLQWRFTAEKTQNAQKRIVYKKVGSTFYLTLNGQKFEPLSSQILDLNIDGNRCRVELKSSNKNDPNALNKCLDTEGGILTCDNRKLIKWKPVSSSIANANGGKMVVSSTTVSQNGAQQFIYTAARSIADDILLISTHANTANDRNAISRLEKIVASIKYETNKLTQEQVEGDTVQIDGGGDILANLKIYSMLMGRDGYIFVNDELARGKDRKRFEKSLITSDQILLVLQVALAFNKDGARKKGDVYSFNGANVFDGNLIHSINMLRFNLEDLTFEFLDPWGMNKAFLEEKNNLAGIKAVKIDRGFKVTEAEFKKVVYNIYVDKLEFDKLTSLLSSAEKDLTKAVNSLKKAAIQTPDTVYFREEVINTLGYVFLHHKVYERAILVFKMNTELHPTSANTYDSLAEAYAALGDKPNAIAMYKKVLAVLPTDKSINETFRKQLKTNAEVNLKKLQP